MFVKNRITIAFIFFEMCFGIYKNRMSIDFVHSYSKTSGKSESDLSEVFLINRGILPSLIN